MLKTPRTRRPENAVVPRRIDLKKTLRQVRRVDPEIMEFLEDLDRRLQPHMKNALARVPDLQPLKEGLTYQIMSRGKRIRAALCVSTCEVFGRDYSDALAFAATIEHLQNFTLIHDDIADGDTQRRFQESIWKRFGVAHGINIGDTFVLFASLAILEASYPERVKLRLMKLISEYGLQMIEGQTLDINLRHKHAVTEHEYMECTKKKTGAFLAMAAVGGGIIGGASARNLARLREFALLAGTAFQIKDDILDVDGFKGRDTGSDVLEGKKTLMVIHAMQTATASDRAKLLEILQKPRRSKSGAEIQWACDLFRKVGAIEYAELVSKQLIHQACVYLVALPENEAKHRLIRICSYLSSRLH
jgi:geranylgeranyl diphosphate synthase type I